MAENNPFSKPGAGAASEPSQGRRFRLPKLFADSEDDLQEAPPAPPAAAPAPVAAAPSPPAVSAPLPPLTVPTAGNEVELAPVHGTPQEYGAMADVDGVPEHTTQLEAPAPVTASPQGVTVATGDPDAHYLPGHHQGAAGVVGIPQTAASSYAVSPAMPDAGDYMEMDEEGTQDLLAAALHELTQMRTRMDIMNTALTELNERGTAQDKVFNMLHTELQDYKNDFIYERLKPVIRPLLFLFDSMEQFDAELSQFDRQDGQERRRGSAPRIMRENLEFFRDQLVEALRICEVTPMPTPEGQFDPQWHKAIDTVPVDGSQDNMIQRVVRSGWCLNGRTFRPAEVIVGKWSADYDSQVWNQGKGSVAAGAEDNDAPGNAELSSGAAGAGAPVG